MLVKEGPGGQNLILEDWCQSGPEAGRADQRSQDKKLLQLDGAGVGRGLEPNTKAKEYFWYLLIKKWKKVIYLWQSLIYRLFVSSVSSSIIIGLITVWLAPGRLEWNLWQLIFKLIWVTAGWHISCEIALRWMSLDLTGDKSTLVQVLAWCHQATGHYLSKWWPGILLPYDVTKPPWVKTVNILIMATESYYFISTPGWFYKCSESCQLHVWLWWNSHKIVFFVEWKQV